MLYQHGLDTVGAGTQNVQTAGIIMGGSPERSSRI